MTLIAVPFDPFTQSDRSAELILDSLVAMPNIFSTPGPPEERRVLIASVISDPLNKAWMVWQGSDLLGMFMLTGIIPMVDAFAHFCFFDRQLFGRRSLLWNAMGKAFHELGLQRLTVELPEHLTPIIKFVRNKLSFRYEGETQAGEHPLIVSKLGPYVAHAGSWAARLGSRREQAYWRADTGEWIDLIRLRLLRSEYDALGG